jgi:LysR family hydrogen peroxide-inducible transcriptional activator
MIDEQLSSIVADVAAMSTQVVGSVDLGVVGTTARWLVPTLLERLSATHPSVRMRITDGTSALLVPQVVSSRLDLAVINLPYPERAIHVSPLFAEDRVLIAPGDHPLADRTHVTLEEIAQFEPLLEPKGNFFRDQLDAYAHTNGFEFRPKAEIDGLRLLASMAFAGFGIAILPASAAPTWLDGDWNTVPILDVPPRAIGLARRRAGILGAPQQAVERLIHTIVDERIPTTAGLHPAGEVRGRGLELSSN